MKAVLVNYNYTPDWLNGYDLDYVIYDRSDSPQYLKDFPKERVIRTENVGNVDYDKLDYLVKQYEELPDVFLWGKTNLFKYIEQEEFDKALRNPVFTPLLTQKHMPKWDSNGVVSFYENGMYHERASTHTYGSWIGQRTWVEWANFFHLPDVDNIPFPPGGNYILTRERVHRYPRILYETMRNLLPYTQLPGEAHLCERSYYMLWR